MALAAVAAGASGLLVEVHPTPDRALSDGYQSLHPEQFTEVVQDCRAHRAKSARHHRRAETFTPEAPIVAQPDLRSNVIRDYVPAELARAKTIPARWYLDPQMLELEREKVFGRTWQPVGFANEGRRTRHVFLVRNRRRTRCRRASQGRRAARVLQRVPPPRVDYRRWRRQSRDAALSVSQLDLRARRPADRVPGI